MVILLSEAKAARATLKAWVFFGVRRFGADGEIQLQASRVNLDRLQLLHFEVVPALGSEPGVHAEVAAGRCL